MAHSTEPLGRFHSGMHVPQSGIRKWMAERYEEAHSEWYAAYNEDSRIQRAKELFRVIRSVGEIEIVEESDFTGIHRKYDDAHYVFGKRRLETWATPGFKLPNGFVYTPLAFLRTHGYELKCSPDADDVVA
jgi:hypothetical protein